jgi:hypothetical protein
MSLQTQLNLCTKQRNEEFVALTSEHGIKFDIKKWNKIYTPCSAESLEDLCALLFIVTEYNIKLFLRFRSNFNS